ncbi:phage tail protein [Streptomyces eurythermus]|uniref:phage tail protein n=1 Tax=Streptomyces eurythermus TaxID=42237 RepID=UPI00340503D2
MSNNDVEIRVRVTNNTAAGIASVNRSIQRLGDDARAASRGLNGLTERATAASLSLRALRDSAQDASRSLRSLNSAARSADTRFTTLSDRSRTLRRDTDELDGSMRRLGGSMGSLRGGGGSLRASMGESGDSMERLRKSALLLAPALLPIAAQAVPLAANVGAAALSVGAFGLAIAGQLSAVKEASDAEKKLNDAIAQHGAHSAEAAKAQADYSQQLQRMDPATRKAAVGLSTLKGQYQAWSRSLAGDTMPVVTKSFVLLGDVLPRLSPMVKSTATQMDRLMNVAAGGMQSAGFDRFMKSVADFSAGALARMTTGLVHLTQAMNTGEIGGGLRSLMDYARENGPLVADTLKNLGGALGHLVVAASDTGVSMLTLVNAFAKLVNSIPTGLMSNVLQLYAGFKLLRVGMEAVSTVASASALGRLRAYFQLMGRAGIGTTLRATAASLTTMQRLGAVGGVLSAVAIGIGALAEKARGAPPNVDKLTTSLKQLATTGKFTGELRKTFGDVDGLVAKIGELGKKSEQMSKTPFGFRIPGLDDVADKIKGAVHDITDGNKSLNALKDDFEGLDKAMAGLVSSGNAKLAAKDFSTIKDAAMKGGHSLKEVNKLFPEYKAALADLKAEQQLAAEGMGLFGSAAQAVQGKLAEQKASADGLRQSIEALNDANRSALGGMIGFEASIDTAAKAAKDNADSLRMVNGSLDLNSPKAQAAATALNELATKTKDAALASREATGSWDGALAIYERGHAQFIKTAQAMGLNKEEAAALADQIAKIPDKKTRIQMDKEDAQRGLQAFNAEVRKTPGAKKVTLQTLSGAAEKVLEAFGYKVKHLPNGQVVVTAATGGALGAIRNVAGALNNIDGKVATTYVNTVHHTVFTAPQKGGGPPVVKHDYASGGRVKGYAGGGDVQSFPDGGYVRGPGTGTSDSILAFMGSGAVAAVSNTEYVIKAAAVQKYGVKMLDAINDGRLPVTHLAKGGKAKPKMSQAQLDARRELSGSFGISAFGRIAGYQRTPFEKSLGAPSDVNALVSSLNDAAAKIRAAFSGKTETRLLKQLSSVGKALIGYEKKLTSVTASLDKAKDKLNSLKDASSQLASSVKGNLISSANITKGASGEGLVTLSSIRSNMRMNKDKVTAFASALKQLRAKGFSKSIIQQVAEAGIDGGGLETAGALLQASASEVQSINATQADIEKAAASAGKTTADTVYDKAIKQQERYVKSLEAQQKKLTQSMEALAKVMERALKDALGKGKGKKAAGGIVGAAASGGLRSSLTWVGEQGPELLDLPAGSRVWSNPDSRRKLAAAEAPWTSMLTSPRRAPAASTAAAGGAPAASQPIVIRLQLGRHEFEEIWVDVGRKAVQTRGSIEATLRPPRGR